jgi:hypothetical protein
MDANTDNIYPKTKAAITLVESGMDIKSALQIVNQKKDIAESTTYAFKKKMDRYSLTRPAIVKAANNQIKRILAGEGREVNQQKVINTGEVIDYKEIITPSDTNILEAVDKVYSRFQPIIKEQEQKGNADILSLVVLAIAGKVEGETQKVIEMPVDTVENT